MTPLLAALDAHGYAFTTITPASHKRVARRWSGPGAGLRDLFGWSRAIDPATIAPDVRSAADAAGVLAPRDDAIAASVRVSRVHGLLFAHSAFPTTADDSVFLGPDSTRFADFITAHLPAPRPGLRIVDIGAGAGVGGLIAARALPGSALTLSDINPAALAMARHNAAHAGIDVALVAAPGLSGVAGTVDLALMNPPYMADPARRAYRDGGAMLGAKLSLDLATEALARLAPGGRALLYTASAIVDGRDALHAALAAAARDAGARLAYRELDPDVFGEELSREPYASARVERLALVGAVIDRP